MDASTKDGSATGDAGTDAGADAEGDAGGTSLNLNGCTAAVYKDETANATPTITWGFGTVPAAGSCITVKKGTAVTWDTAAVDGLVGHPLDAKDGTTPTPIVLANTGTSVTYTFNDEGLFGYVCVNHAFMTGAINVVP